MINFCCFFDNIWGWNSFGKTPKNTCFIGNFSHFYQILWILLLCGLKSLEKGVTRALTSLLVQTPFLPKQGPLQRMALAGVSSMISDDLTKIDLPMENAPFSGVFKALEHPFISKRPFGWSKREATSSYTRRARDVWQRWRVTRILRRVTDAKSDSTMSVDLC